MVVCLRVDGDIETGVVDGEETGLAGTSKTIGAEAGGRLEKQLALPPRQLFKDAYAKAPEKTAPEPRPEPEPEPRSVRGMKPAGDRASKEREEAPMEEDTPAVKEVNPRSESRAGGEVCKPWEVEGISRALWYRRRAKARAGQ
jgi:hypothetical protein